MPRSKSTLAVDVEEAHALVKEEADTDSVKLARREARKLQILYITSALLDISGYVIRTIGWFAVLYSDT